MAWKRSKSIVAPETSQCVNGVSEYCDRTVALKLTVVELSSLFTAEADTLNPLPICHKKIPLVVRNVDPVLMNAGWHKWPVGPGMNLEYQWSLSVKFQFGEKMLTVSYPAVAAEPLAHEMGD